MLDITIKVIPYKAMKYSTCGDWTDDGQITVADTGNDDYNFLIGLHEMVEWYLCKKNGITDEEVTAFDKEFEEKRLPGNYDEPGDFANAPYSSAHFFATSIERLMSQVLEVGWEQYEETINDLD